MDKFLTEVLLENPSIFPDRFYLSIQSSSVKGSETKIDEDAVNKEMSRVSDIIKDDLFPSIPVETAMKYLYRFPDLFPLITNYYSIPEVLSHLPQFIFYQTKYPEIKEFLSDELIFPEDETNINWLTTQLVERDHEEYLLKYWANHPTITTPVDEECEITKAPWKISNPNLREAITQYHLITYGSEVNHDTLLVFIMNCLTPGDIFTLCLNHITTDYYNDLCKLIPNMLNIQSMYPKTQLFPEYSNRYFLLKFRDHLESTLGNPQLIDTLRML